jgi:hypothetical protein
MKSALFSFLLLVTAPVYAHHSFAATYDGDRKVSLRGTITRIDWTNPHAYLFVNVQHAGGATANWAVEFGNPIELERNGWRASAVRIGDEVTIEGNPARENHERAYANSVVLTHTGRRLFTVAERPPVASGAKQPTPRWPNGHIRLGPPPGKKGYWGPASTPALVEGTGATIPMDRDGLLRNLADLDRVAPMLPWAKAVYEYRQRTLLKDDPLTRCLPPGGPRQFQIPNGFQFIEQPDLGRILVLLGGGDRNWRVIYTDGRAQGQPDEVVRGYYGNSVGRWEGDRLVVDTTGFNERFWFTNGGLPHTEALHLAERFSRPDLSTLKYEVTVEDPRTYSRPWTGGWTSSWMPDQEMQEYFCEENAESTFIR